MKLPVDSAFDRLFEVAIEGLSEDDRSLQAKKDAVKLIIAPSWQATGDQQRDYERLRNAIERESDRISSKYEEHLVAADSLSQDALPFGEWMATQYSTKDATDAQPHSNALFRVYHLTDTRDERAQEISHNYALLDARRDVDKAADVFRKPANNCAYQLVAELRASDLEDVFRLTNTIEEYWWTNPEVRAKFQGHGCRSTSVGDIVFDGAGNGHFCASVGWVEMNLVDPQIEAQKSAPQGNTSEAESESLSPGM